jgi:hypothetical protein
MKFLVKFLGIGAVSAQLFSIAEPIYAHSLRDVPENVHQQQEKLRQKRVLQEVTTRLEQVKRVILDDAQHQTETNFTLFCIEPNDSLHSFQGDGVKYTLPGLGKNPSSRRPIDPKPKCSVKDGYELYRRSRMDHNTHMDPKMYPPLDYDTPLVSIQLFFQFFNQQFPDLRLRILHERIAKTPTLFETDCCPMYIVSWKE